MKLRNIVRYLYLVIKKIFSVFYCIIYFNDSRVAIYNDLTIGLRFLKEKNAKLPHPFGVVIGRGVIIGENCKFYQCVTIGSKLEDGQNYPVLGNNVTVYANSVIVGDVVIGDNVIIGASTLITKSIPSNSVAFGNPVRIYPLI